MAYCEGVFRPPTDADGEFPVELMEFAEGDASTDIEFGARRSHVADSSAQSRGPRRVGWSRNAKLVVAAAVVALVATAFVVGASDNHSPTAAPVTTAARSEVTTGPTAALGSVLMNDQGWGLFFANGSSGHQVSRLDLVTGTVTAVPNAVYSPSLGLSGTGASARVVQPTDVGGATARAGGPDGAVWLAGINGSTTGLSLVRTQEAGGSAVVANYDLGSLGAVFLRMIGSMATGEPVFAAPDGSAFVYNPTTGMHYRLANGLMVSGVRNGNYGDVECDRVGTCQLLIHGGEAYTYSMPYSSDASFSIAPDGGHALVTVLKGDAVVRTMINIRTGAGVVMRQQSDGSGADNAPASTAVWSPDGLTAFFVNGSQLVKVSSDGMWTQRIQLPSAIPDGSVTVGVA